MQYYFASKTLVLKRFATFTEHVDSVRLEGTMSVNRQLLGDPECSFNGVTCYGIV